MNQENASLIYSSQLSSYENSFEKEPLSSLSLLSPTTTTTESNTSSSSVQSVKMKSLDHLITKTNEQTKLHPKSFNGGSLPSIESIEMESQHHYHHHHIQTSLIESSLSHIEVAMMMNDDDIEKKIPNLRSNSDYLHLRQSSASDSLLNTESFLLPKCTDSNCALPLPGHTSTTSVPETTTFKTSTSSFPSFSIITHQISVSNSSFGTKVDEDHRNYILMYDMLTGIRIAVSRNQAKSPKRLEETDFKATHKLAFDMYCGLSSHDDKKLCFRAGNELTPSSKYDFKFKDYAPWVFRELRNAFKIDPAEYLVSLTGKYVLSELNSPGKSGSFFYYSQDYRFIIKTIHHSEHLFLRKILKQYYRYVKESPNTLLSRFFGLHRVKLPKGKKIHFVVMGNILPLAKDIHEIYDIKGSTLGRKITKDEIQANPRVTRKDINWLESNHKLRLGSHKRSIFLEQLTADEKFLESLNIMDYSLLIGIHYIHRGNREKLRDKALSVYEPKPDLSSLESEWKKRHHHWHKKSFNKYKMARVLSAIRRPVVNTDPIALENENENEELPSERKYFLFYKEQGGFTSTDESNQPYNEIYFIGIIDILTPYNYRKKIEHCYKSLNYDKSVISATSPREYGKRFIKFILFRVLKVDENNQLLSNRKPDASRMGSSSLPNPVTPLSMTSKCNGNFEDHIGSSSSYTKSEPTLSSSLTKSESVSSLLSVPSREVSLKHRTSSPLVKSFILPPDENIR